MAKIVVLVRPGNLYAYQAWLEDDNITTGKLEFNMEYEMDTISILYNNWEVGYCSVSQNVAPIINPKTGEELQFYQDYEVKYFNIFPTMDDVVKHYSVAYNPIEIGKRFVAIVLAHYKKLNKPEKKKSEPKIVSPELLAKIEEEKAIVKAMRKGELNEAVL